MNRIFFCSGITVFGTSSKLFFKNHISLSSSLSPIKRATRSHRIVNANISLKRSYNQCANNSSKFKYNKNQKSNYSSSSSNSTNNTKKNSKLRELMKKYGFSALGVYLTLSLIDLPICFYMVHSMGEERIKLALNSIKNLVGLGMDEEELKTQIRIKQEQRQREQDGNATNNSHGLSWYWEYLKESNILTEFLIAYGIHKSLIFIRLPITAAITPSIVKYLQRLGFNIGKKGGNVLNGVTGENFNKFVQSNGSNKYSIKKNTKDKKWFNGIM
ncbi:Nat2p SCDLUD_001536 [Saccharomycodes ludwigii]|uniref:Nat2p n=1 Tax=Saccharomycodes ludwigii TaxID=36035 RepID=UPI001E861698|nr:hypothetical protein SCDLUD_001536 [Saccharomycodes ludwigii]KAH3901760.1 hypothetical protein SCDLUD_001536 [Saccharomycodes ludwigii]